MSIFLCELLPTCNSLRQSSNKTLIHGEFVLQTHRISHFYALDITKQIIDLHSAPYPEESDKCLRLICEAVYFAVYHGEKCLV